MAELSLREQIYDYMKWLAENWDAYSHGIKIDEVITYGSATDSIIKLMLAKVNKAGLTDFETIANDVINHTEDIKKNYRHISYALVEAGAKAQLQAIKSILEGK